MSRLTKNISDKQTYCGYEVKDCKYQQIYGFKKYSELENYVDCDLTLAIDKLGQLEDLIENADDVKIIEKNGIATLHIDMVLDEKTYPIAKELFKK